MSRRRCQHSTLLCVNKAKYQCSYVENVVFILYARSSAFGREDGYSIAFHLADISPISLKRLPKFQHSNSNWILMM